MKKVFLAILLIFLVIAFMGCGQNKSSKVTTQNEVKAGTKVLTPAETKEAVKKSTTTAKKVEVDLKTIDAQLGSIGDFDIVDESGLD